MTHQHHHFRLYAITITSIFHPPPHLCLHQHLPDGSYLRYKSRLVVQGCRHIAGVDYNETFSPAVRPDTLKTVLALSLIDSEVVTRHCDVVTAFLQSPIDTDVYLKPPPGYSSLATQARHDTNCLKLLKNMYRLKQAPRGPSMVQNPSSLSYCTRLRTTTVCLLRVCETVIRWPMVCPVFVCR